MPGRIALVDAAEGAHVGKGQKVVVMEALKMELGQSAPFDGVVEAVKVKIGDQVREGRLLAVIGLRPATPMSNCSAASRREPPASTKPMTRLLNSPGYGPRIG
jgi:pyruvate/2-oxoglutarate dehydrogenase complex dihydrolipoamide acyltransferase (E2) component